MSFEKKIICINLHKKNFYLKKIKLKNVKFTSNYVGRTRQIFKKIITAIKKLIKIKILEKKNTEKYAHQPSVCYKPFPKTV